MLTQCRFNPHPMNVSSMLIQCQFNAHSMTVQPTSNLNSMLIQYQFNVNSIFNLCEIGVRERKSTKFELVFGMRVELTVIK